MTTTAQDVIAIKLGRQFEIMDANDDGYLDWSDYQNVCDRYIEAYKLDKNDRRARALYSFYQTYWLELLRHADVQADRLTKEQFVTANRLAGIDTSRLNMADGLGHVIFDVIDADLDNEISKDEFARFVTDVWKIEAPDSMDTFTELDSDDDSKISRQEFLRGMREYFLSNDPDAPGSLVLGRI
jgi:hypothetical protein